MANLLDVDPTILEKNLMLKELEGINEEAYAESLFNLKPKEPEDTLWKPVKPLPGYCLKLRTCEGDKIFVNICHTDAIPEPEDIPEEKLLQMIVDDGEPSFRIPISIGDLHIESDKSRNPCSVYDIAVNSKFFKKMETSEAFNIFFLNVSIQGLQEKYSLSLDLKSEKPFLLLKNRKVFGSLQMHRIQQRNVKKTMGKLIEEMNSKPYQKTSMINVVGETKSEQLKEVTEKSQKKQIISTSQVENLNGSIKKANDENNLGSTVNPSYSGACPSVVASSFQCGSQSGTNFEDYEKGIAENSVTKDFSELNGSQKELDSVKNHLELNAALKTEELSGHIGQGDVAEGCSGLFCIKQFPEFGHPQLMIASLRLNVKSSRDFDLELDTNRVSVTTRGSAKPWFEFTLPYEIDVNKVEACFVTQSQRLMIKMDVVKS